MKNVGAQLTMLTILVLSCLSPISCNMDDSDSTEADPQAKAAGDLHVHEHGDQSDHGHDSEIPDYHALLGVEDNTRASSDEGRGRVHSPEEYTGQDHGTAVGDHDHSHGCEETLVSLSETASANMGITLISVASEIYYDQIKIPGTLSADPDRLVEVSAPAMVRVINLSATPPSAVQAGQRLAVVELADPEVRNLQMDAVDKRTELMAAILDRDRDRRYLESLRAGNSQTPEIERVTADLQIAEARVQAIESSLIALLASLKVAGLSDLQLSNLKEHGKVTTQIEIFAPNLANSPSMEVADRPVSLGETVDAGSTLFSLIALDELRVIGEAFEADLPIIRYAMREGLPVDLLFPAEGDQIKNLHIEALEGALDGVNRVTHFFIRLPNELLSERVENNLLYEERRHRAGARVQIMVATQEIGQRYVIPSSAIVHESGEAWGFVKVERGFQRLALSPESIDGRLAILPLDSHLHTGDQLVVQGTLQLNLLWHEQHSGSTQTIDPHAGHSH